MKFIAGYRGLGCDCMVLPSKKCGKKQVGFLGLDRFSGSFMAYRSASNPAKSRASAVVNSRPW